MVELERLKQKLTSVKRLAWRPIVQEGDGDLTASKFAGKPWLNAGEKWPVCPNCGKPMQLFLQLNLDELPENLNSRFGSGIFQFFYCTNVVSINHDVGLYGRTVEECEALMRHLPQELLAKRIIGTSVDWEDGLGKIKFLEIQQHCAIDCEGWEAFSKCQIVRIVQPTNTAADFEIPEVEELFDAKIT